MHWDTGSGRLLLLPLVLPLLLPRRLPLRSECRTHPHVVAALPPVGTATMPGYPVHSYPAQLADSLQDHHRSGGARAPALHAAPGWRPPASL